MPLVGPAIYDAGDEFRVEVDASMDITVALDDVEAFWRQHGPSLGGGDPPVQSWFGDSPAMADDLADLVRTGTKRATASLVRDYVAEREPIPEPGQRTIVVDGAGKPVAVIRTTEVRVGPLSSVTQQFAWDEGEGDRSREWWLDAHRAFFRRAAEQAGRTPEPNPDVVFERFELLWPVPE